MAPDLVPWHGGPGGRRLATTAAAAAATILARRERQTVFRLGPGLLVAPPFQREGPWLSATMLAGHDPAGGSQAGSMQRALEAEAPAEQDRAMQTAARLLRARLLRERTGGAYWADAPPAGLMAHPGSGLAIVVATRQSGPLSGRMLAAALARVGASRTLLLHAIPSAANSLTLEAAKRAGCRAAQGALDPWLLLEAAAEVHVAEDTEGCGGLGLLAALSGVPVICHGRAWFSGHGLTRDAAVMPQGALRSQARLASAALVDGVRYADPFTGKPCDVERALDLAAEWRRICHANRAVAACIGMQFWKRRRMAQFLHTGLRAPSFHRDSGAAVMAAKAAQGGVAAWASRMPAGLAARAAAAAVPVLRVEDGFLRSVGLGSDFMLPCSIVLDGAGLYYDPRQPSDLETLLAGTAFAPALLARARLLVKRLVSAGLTKYNTGAGGLPTLPRDGRPVILVVGQVADDLSVRLGGGAATNNADLLRQVRAAHPRAHILYKPHPDVDAGHRPGGIPDRDALQLADAVVRGVPMAALIAAVDELHTISSLAGFEALLRGRRVVVWGRPFYAGWGLTTDQVTIARRTRRLALDELAAGVLLLYPRYLDPVTGLPCPAETLLDRLTNQAIWRPGPLVRLRRMQGRGMNGWRTLAGVTHGRPSITQSGDAA